MKRLISLFSAVTIFLWILPLGAFIKPAQEKTACGGNRAFHMCSCPVKISESTKEATPQKIVFTNASGSEKTNRSASGSGDNGFANNSTLAKIQDNTSKLAELNLILSRQLFFPTPSPVPKA